ncbi:MAG: hypothetical protein IIW01_08505 [Thermoguttaceae bacterium]|nr:hypothetical protein [Thermoguttaceae bacterium]
MELNSERISGAARDKFILKLGDVFEISTERFCELRPRYVELLWEAPVDEQHKVSPRGYVYGQVVYEIRVPDWNLGANRQLFRFFEGSFAQPLELDNILSLPEQFQCYFLYDTAFTPLHVDGVLRVVGNVEPPERYREPPTTKRYEFYKPWNQKIWTVGTNVHAPEGPERRTLGPILPEEYKNCPDGKTHFGLPRVSMWLNRLETGWSNASDSESTPPEEVIPHKELDWTTDWATWDKLSNLYHYEKSIAETFKLREARAREAREKERKSYRNSIKKPLLQLLNEFDRIARTYEEIGDTDVREQIRVALNDGYVTPKDGFELPETFGMFEPDGNAQVGAALRQFLAAANKIAAQRKNLQTAKGRLRSIQDENVTSDAGTLYDEYWGYVDEDEFDEE